MKMNDKLTSPCINICEIDNNTGFCKGCFRTKMEIAKWSDLNYLEQKDLLIDLRRRKFNKTGKSRRSNRRNILG